MADNTKIITHTDEFIHVKSESVPDWVKNLASLKDKIIDKIDSSIQSDAKPNIQPKKDK
jgi:hypothetical protein